MHPIDEDAPADQVVFAQSLEDQFTSALVAHQFAERLRVVQLVFVGLDAGPGADLADGLLGDVVGGAVVLVDRLGIHQQHVRVAQQREVDRREVFGRHLVFVEGLAAPLARIADGAHHVGFVDQVVQVELAFDLLETLDRTHGEDIVVVPRCTVHAAGLQQDSRLLIVVDRILDFAAAGRVRTAVALEVVSREVPDPAPVDDHLSGDVVLVVRRTQVALHAVGLRVELPEGVGAVVVAVGVVAGPLRVVGVGRLRFQTDQVADAAVGPLVRTGPVAEELGLPHRLVILRVILVPDHVDEDLLVARVEVMLARFDHLVGPVGGLLVHLLFREALHLGYGFAGHEEVDAGQNAFGHGLADARGGLVDLRIEIADDGLDLVHAPFEHLLLGCCGQLHVIGVGRGGRLHAQGHVAPGLGQQEVIIGPQEPGFGHVSAFRCREILGIDLRGLDALDVLVGILDALIEFEPGVVDDGCSGRMVVAVGAGVDVVVVVEVAEVVGVADLQRIVVSVELLAAQRAVDTRQTVLEFGLGGVIVLCGDDLRVGVEERAGRESRAEERQGPQSVYVFHFHDEMVLLDVRT